MFECTFLVIRSQLSQKRIHSDEISTFPLADSLPGVLSSELPMAASWSSGSGSNITRYDHPQLLFKVAPLLSGHSLFSCRPRFAFRSHLCPFPTGLLDTRTDYERSESEEAQSCLTLATPWTVAHQAPLSMGVSRQEHGVGCHCLLQRIFPTQESNPGLLHCRQTLYHLSHRGSPGTGYVWQGYIFQSGLSAGFLLHLASEWHWCRDGIPLPSSVWSVSPCLQAVPIFLSVAPAHFRRTVVSASSRWPQSLESG